MDFPSFKEDEPSDWVRKCKKYFQLYHIEEETKVILAKMHLEGKVDVCHQGFKWGKDRIVWQDFKDALLKRFGEVGQSDVVEFNKLQQTTSVLAYQEKFKELKSRIILGILD